MKKNAGHFRVFILLNLHAKNFIEDNIIITINDDENVFFSPQQQARDENVAFNGKN